MVKESDYCSLSPDWIKKYLFFGKKSYYLGNACKQHDIDYAVDNLTPQRRLKADKALKKGILKALPVYFAWIAHLYYIVCRIFGKIYETKIQKKIRKLVISLSNQLA